MVRARDQNHVAAAAAIATTRTASRYILLASKGQAAITSVACLDVDFSFVDEQRLAALFGWANADEFAESAAIAEFDHARHFRK